jgi:hypothetical protein
MKKLVHLYQQNPLLAMIINGVAFFLWAFTIIIIITVMAVAFTG